MQNIYTIITTSDNGSINFLYYDNKNVFLEALKEQEWQRLTHWYETRFADNPSHTPFWVDWLFNGIHWQGDRYNQTEEFLNLKAEVQSLCRQVELDYKSRSQSLKRAKERASLVKRIDNKKTELSKLPLEIIELETELKGLEG